MATPVPASTILLLRDAPGLEVMMVARHRGLAFGAGAWVFPGGKVADADRDGRWAGFVRSPSTPEATALRIAAVRETFEEAGVLIAETPEGEPPPKGLIAELAAEREAVEADPARFLDLVAGARLVLDLSRLTPFAHWITPAFEPRRYDTHFFLARAPEGQAARHDGRETVDLHWAAPAEALRRCEAGETKLMFPTRLNLIKLGRCAASGQAIAEAAAAPPVTVEPRVVDIDGVRFLDIPEEAGYGLSRERLHWPP